MNDELQKLIESLREELRQYGQMLALLEDQQAGIIQRHNEELLDATSAVDQQAACLQAVRRERDQARLNLARALQAGDDAPLAELASLIPADYRPLLGALTQENNHLLQRIQQRARQNHVLLRRSLEILEGFLSAFSPGRAPVYDGGGSLQPGAERPAALYEAIG